MVVVSRFYIPSVLPMPPFHPLHYLPSHLTLLKVSPCYFLFYSCYCWLWVRLWVSVKCLHCNRLLELHLWSYKFHVYTCTSYIPVRVFPCSGIGLALCERLLSHDPEGLQLCLACRDPQRARDARAALLATHPTARVTLVQMDTSSVSSVIAAAQEVKRRWDAVHLM